MLIDYEIDIQLLFHVVYNMHCLYLPVITDIRKCRNILKLIYMV